MPAPASPVTSTTPPWRRAARAAASMALSSPPLPTNRCCPGRGVPAAAMPGSVRVGSVPVGSITAGFRGEHGRGKSEKGPGHGRAQHVEPLGEHGVLQLRQHRTGIAAEFLTQRRRGPAQRGERVGLLLPQAQWARTSSRHPSSRNGLFPTRSSAARAASAARPVRRSAATASSRASVRNSVRKATSDAAHPSSACSAKAGPRHHPSASASRSRASSADARRARFTRSSKRQASTACRGSRSAYPGGAVTSTVAGARAGRPGSSDRRRFDT